MKQGIMFNGETPMMDGKWYNPQTGDSFIVRNTFFEDNQLVVQTMDGRMLEYNQLQHYIQSNDNDPIPLPQDKSVTTTNNQLPPEVSSLLEDDYDGMLADDAQLIMGYSQGPDWQEPVRLGNINETHQQSAENTNTIIINKALAKLDLPKLDIKIDETTIPKTAVKMLHDIMDIPADEIVEWYINNMNINELRKQVTEQLNTYISEIIS